MRNKWRIISLTSIIFMVIIRLSFSALAESTSESDNAALRVLSAIGVITDFEDTAAYGNRQLTHAELADALSVILGTTDFNNIVGYNSERFEAKDSVKYNTLLAILVNATGYGVYAENSGGYPIGYRQTANKYGISKGMNLPGEESVTMANFGKLVLNALETDLIQLRSIGKGTKYSSAAGESLLSERLHIEKGKGQISGNRLTRLSGESNLKSNEIEIQKRVYDVGNTNADGMLGFYVTYYAQIDRNTDNRTLLYISSDSTVLEIQAEDIISVQEGVITYYDGTRNRTIKVGAQMWTIYNTKSEGVIDEDMRISAGSLRFIDSRNAGYDVLDIKSYDTFVVDRINVASEIVYGKYAHAESPFLLKEGFEEVLILQNGKEISLESINEWCVLSIAKSKDGKRAVLFASGESVDGTVEEIGTDFIQIRGVKYKISPSYASFVQKEMSIQTHGMFYLDINQQVAAFNLIREQGIAYGYLFGAAISNNLHNTVQLEILTQSNSFEIFDCSPKLKLNGIKIQKTSEIIALVDKGENTKRQIVKYEVNSNNQITRLDTGNLNVTDRNGLRRERAMETLRYRRTGIFEENSTWNHGFAVGGNTYVFWVGDYKEDCRVSRIGTLSNDGLYSVVPYDFDELQIASCLTVRVGRSDSVDHGNPILIYSKMVKALNEDGSPIQKVYGYVSKNLRSFSVSTVGEYVPDMGIYKEGDILQYKTDAKGDIIAVKPLVISGKNTPYTYTQLVAKSAAATYVYGKVVSRKFDILAIDHIYEGSSIQKPFSIGSSSMNFYLYEEQSNKKITNATSYDIRAEDVVFLFYRYGIPYEAVIFRYE